MDINLVLRPLVMFAGDPTIRLRPGLAERATWTPEGPGSIRVTWRSGEHVANVETFGAGGNWPIDRAPQLLGATDDPSGFKPTSTVVSGLWARFSGDRVPRTETIWHDILWTIVQQRIRRQDAASQWRKLIEVVGEPAPGIEGLRTPPEPARLARVAPWSLRAFGIDSQRAHALIRLASYAPSLQRLVGETEEQSRRKLQTIKGIGPWTASCLSAFTFGNPDTVIVGDHGIPSLIASTLTGERRADDARMDELLGALSASPLPSAAPVFRRSHSRLGLS